ncbi:unnamed protein product, partial [Polarella glacialis]
MLFTLGDNILEELSFMEVSIAWLQRAKTVDSLKQVHSHTTGSSCVGEPAHLKMLAVMSTSVLGFFDLVHAWRQHSGKSHACNAPASHTSTPKSTNNKFSRVVLVTFSVVVVAVVAVIAVTRTECSRHRAS